MKGSDLPPGGSGQKPTSGPPRTRKGKRGADASQATASPTLTTARRSKRLAGAPPDTPAGAGPSSTTARRSNRLADAPPATPAAATAGPTSPSPTTARRSKRLAGASPHTPAGAGPSSTTARRSNRLADAPPATPAAAKAGPTSPSPTTARRSNRLAGAPPGTPAETGPSSTTARRSKRLAGVPAAPAEAGQTSPSPTTARWSKRSAGKSPVIPAGSGSSSSAAKSKRTADASSANPAEARPSSGRGDAADQETTREAVLYVRRERSVLAPDGVASPYNEPRVAAAVALSRVRSAGAGELWNTPGRDRAHVEPMQKAILDARRERSLAPDDPASPYNEPRVAAATTLSWVRSAGAGALWNTPGRDHADKKTMREAVLPVRRERSVLAPDDPASPYARPRRRRADAGSGPAPTRVLRPRAGP